MDSCASGILWLPAVGRVYTAGIIRPQAISAANVSVDSCSVPSVISICLHQAKTDPFGERVLSIYLSRMNSELCPVVAMLNYLVAHPSIQGPHIVHQDGSPLLKQQFITMGP